MTWSLLTVWLGLVMVAVGVYPSHPLLVVVPGLVAVTIGLALQEDKDA